MNIQKLTAPYEITKIDPYLEPYGGEIALRMDRFKEKRGQLVGDSETLLSFANGHLFFGIIYLALAAAFSMMFTYQSYQTFS